MGSYWKMLCALYWIMYIQGAYSTITDYTAGTKLSFASYYSDHMVLQRGPKRANVWGYADKQYLGKTVDITLSGPGYSKVYKAAVKIGPDPATATWEVRFAPVTSKDPFQITAQLMSEKISISDILFGDVWLCGGQSNMCFTVMQIFNATQELTNAAKYKNIRVFSAKKIQSKVPYHDLKGIDLHWALPNKTNLGNGPFSYFSAVCWLYGRHLYDKLGYPIGLVESAWGGTPVEAWSTPEGLKYCHVKDNQDTDESGSYFDKTLKDMSQYDAQPDWLSKLRGPVGHSELFKAMIYPLVKMTIHGAIWYQGESNSGKPNSYKCTFPRMIADWRRYFHLGSGLETDATFPFGFVQLAPVMPQYPKSSDDFASIRWHQTADVGYVPNKLMPNTFMATAVDLPDNKSPYSSIHPRFKEPIGFRLAQAGLAVAYGMKGYPYQGPNPIIYTPGSDTFNIAYDRIIQLKSKSGFEICCNKDNSTCSRDTFKGWHHVNIIKTTQLTITLDCKLCHGMEIQALRYLWQNTPCAYMKCAVYGQQSGLPQAPFYKQKH